MNLEEAATPTTSTWSPISEAFFEWLGDRESILEPGLFPEPTMKVLAFLALLESKKPCTYGDIKAILRKKIVIQGNIPDNTLRTAVLNLGRTLERSEHALELRSLRGRFQLITRVPKTNIKKQSDIKKNFPVILLEPAAITPEEVACVLVEKAMLPFHALYCLEWSARWWETYSKKEAEIRMPYEAGAWEKLGIKDRLSKTDKINKVIGIVSLMPAEGLAEIELLKKILHHDNNETVHYLAVDSSPRLLRGHIGLLKESLSSEIEAGRLLCAGVVANIFTELREAVEKIKKEYKRLGIIDLELEFLPSSCGLLVTYFGNCLGNNYHDQETDFFSIIRSTFQNKPLEILVGVSVLQSIPDEYKRNWDDFLLQTPRHLLEIKQLLKSHRDIDDHQLPEFVLPQSNVTNDRCPPVIPEPYTARHQISGQIYRFYYKLAFDIELVAHLGHVSMLLPQGTLILLYNIIKYDMVTLVDGVKKCGLFNVKYDPHYRQTVDTPNGKREYAVFSTYLEE